MAEKDELSAAMAVALDTMWQQQHLDDGHREWRSVKGWSGYSPEMRIRRPTMRGLLLRGCVRQRSSREMFAEHRDYFEYQITDKGVDWGSDGQS